MQSFESSEANTQNKPNAFGFSTSPQTAKLDLALAKAQGEFKRPDKNATNPHFKSQYATMASVVDAYQEALRKYEINITQWPIHSNDGRVYVTTRLAHAGEWMQAVFSVPVSKQDAQGFGSALTYTRRYTVMAALGLAPDEDDDGNAASVTPSQNTFREPVKPRVSTTNPRPAFVPKKQSGPGVLPATAGPQSPNANMAVTPTGQTPPSQATKPFVAQESIFSEEDIPF